MRLAKEFEARCKCAIKGVPVEVFWSLDHLGRVEDLKERLLQCTRQGHQLRWIKGVLSKVFKLLFFTDKKTYPVLISTKESNEAEALAMWEALRLLTGSSASKKSRGKKAVENHGNQCSFHGRHGIHFQQFTVSFSHVQTSSSKN